MNRIVIKPPRKEMPSKSTGGMKPIHPDLPQIPFFVGIIGPRHRGKSVLLYSLLKNENLMYGKAFKRNNIIFYSPTKGQDPTIEELKLENSYCPQDFPASVLVNDVIAKQSNFLKQDNMSGVLLVFDDITNVRDAWKPIEDLSYKGRHFHIHVLYVAHKMSSILRGVRTQTQQWIIYEPHEQSEFQWILDMFSRRQTKDIWLNALRRCWNIPFNFAYIDFEEKDFDRVYRSGFHDPLFTDNEKNEIQGIGDQYYKLVKTSKNEPKLTDGDEINQT